MQTLEPELILELEALSYVAEKMMTNGELEEIHFYHQAPKEIYKDLKEGGNPYFHPLGNSLDQYHCTKPRFESIKTKLDDLRLRREELDELQGQIKALYDPEADYTTPSDERTLQEGLESTTDKILNGAQGIKGAWTAFEGVIGGLKAGELIGVVGESESGKTTFALNWFHQIMQANPNIKSLNISLEMDETAFLKKIAKMCGDMTQKELVWKVHNESLNLKDFQYGGWENCVFSYGANTLAKIKKSIESNKPNLVMIDHLQFVINDQRLSLGEWINFFCNGLKQIAKQNGCSIILLSQIDKEGAKSHFVKGEQKKLKPKLVNAWGGIAFKAALDCGVVISRDEDRSICYWDKVREAWDFKYRYTDFDIEINGVKGIIYGLRPNETKG